LVNPSCPRYRRRGRSWHRLGGRAQGQAARRARTRLKLILNRLHATGLFAAGMIGDPDPYTAIQNALQYFRVDDIVISTFAETKSGWLRADLIDRVRKATMKPVEHVVHREAVPTEA